MKKSWFLIGAMVLLLGTYLIYLFEFKSYNTSDAEVDLLTKEEYVIELADGSKIILDKNGNLIRHITEADGKVTKVDVNDQISIVSDELATASTTGKKKQEITNGVVGFSSTVSSPNIYRVNGKGVDTKVPTNKNTKTSAKQIGKKYEAALTDIEDQAYTNLDNLIHLATTEYLDMDSKDRKISYPYFYSKYSTAAGKLEARTDKVFDALMKIIEHELQANGHSTKTVEKMRVKYKKTKKKVRRDIMKETTGL